MNIFQRTIVEARDKLARHIDNRFLLLERFIMSIVSDAAASAQAKVDALHAEITVANTKIDALIVLAQNAGVSPADIAAITAIGTSADAGLADLQAEEAKIDAANPPPAAP